MQILLRNSLLFCLASLMVQASGVGAESRPPRIYRDKVEPHWFGARGEFWYRLVTGDGRSEFVRVDPESAARKPAFDHERMARALVDAGVEGLKPEDLPLENLDFEAEGTLGFRLRGSQWTCRLSDYGVEKASTAAVNNGLALDPDAPAASRRTGEETTITFSNRTDSDVDLFWLDSEGEKRSYGKIKAGETREQHTFGGHVWRVVDGAGKTLGVFQAQDESTFAEITGTPPATASQRPPRRRREQRGDGTSPNAQWKARFQDFNLVVTEVATGAEKSFTDNGTATNGYSGRFFWSPDSRKLVVLRTLKGDDRKVYLVESSPKDQLQPKLHTIDYPKPGDRVDISTPHLFDLASGKEIPVDDSLYPDPWSITQVRWRADSSAFSFLYNRRGHQLLRLLAVDAQSGTVSTIIEERSDTFIDYSTKLVTEYVEQGESSEVLWSSERDGWNHLYLYDYRTGALKNQVTQGAWVVRGIDWVDRENRQVWFRAGGIRPEQDPYFVHFCRVNFDGTGLTILTEGDGTHQVRFSPDRKFLVDTWSRVDQPPRSELRRGADGSQVCSLEVADDAELKNGWRSPEPFVAKGRDGQTDIYGIIHWPKDFDPSAQYPVIESIYAGPQGSFVPKSFHVSYGVQALCERGFVVVQIDGMGTSDRSKKFHDVAARNLGDSGFPDRILWMKAAAAKYACLDLNRVGIYGTSAGGQSALRALLGYGDFYKAAVSDCGCHDNRVDKIWWNEQWMGYPIGEHYAEQSNVTQAHRLQGKLLLMVGELDRNVDPASTMQVVNALIKADKDFDLLIMPGAGHGVLGTPYARRKMLGFFEQHLLRERVR